MRKELTTAANHTVDTTPRSYGTNEADHALAQTHLSYHVDLYPADGCGTLTFTPQAAAGQVDLYPAGDCGRNTEGMGQATDLT